MRSQSFGTFFLILFRRILAFQLSKSPKRMKALVNFVRAWIKPKCSFRLNRSSSIGLLKQILSYCIILLNIWKKYTTTLESQACMVLETNLNNEKREWLSFDADLYAQVHCTVKFRQCKVRITLYPVVSKHLMSLWKVAMFCSNR